MCLFNGRGEISTPTAPTFFIRSFWNSKLRNISGTGTRMQNLVKIGSRGASGRPPKFWPYILGYPFYIFFVFFAQRPGRTARRTATVQVGLPDIPYFTGAPVFQPQSPASRNEATREMKSPVFKLGLLTSHQSPIHRLHFLYWNTHLTRKRALE